MVSFWRNKKSCEEKIRRHQKRKPPEQRTEKRIQKTRWEFIRQAKPVAGAYGKTDDTWIEKAHGRIAEDDGAGGQAEDAGAIGQDEVDDKDLQKELDRALELFKQMEFRTKASG